MLSKAAYRHLSRMTSLAELASFLKANAPKTRKSVKLARGRKQEKAARHMLETARLRADVFERAGGDCELCVALAPTEMHHLKGGSGRRREMQAAENCMAVCNRCHRDYHDFPGMFRDRIIRWAEKYGYPIPARIEHAPLPEKQAVK